MFGNIAFKISLSCICILEHHLSVISLQCAIAIDAYFCSCILLRPDIYMGVCPRHLRCMADLRARSSRASCLECFGSAAIAPQVCAALNMLQACTCTRALHVLCTGVCMHTHGTVVSSCHALVCTVQGLGLGGFASIS